MEQNEILIVEGNIQANIGAIIMLIVGVGVSALVLIFVGTLGGQTYNLVEPKIDAIQNEQIKVYVKEGIISAFQALSTTGSYLPIIVLAVVIFIVLGLIFSMVGGGVGTGMGGTAL
ncbi:MAG: hypothetical protein MUP17_05005 [candidate division Zixibacteria bacterium]|nr:hypothetical protein [candidate division Zixibacteria bacterium]